MPQKEIARQLHKLISPFYKTVISTGQPEFRKTVTSEELNVLLLGVHDIITNILNEDEHI